MARAPASFCCCTRPFGGRQKKPKADISIRVNGKEQMSVPGVAIVNASTIASTPPENGTTIIAIDSMDDDYITTRSNYDSKLCSMSMAELVRTVRIEEGLEVTPRDQNTPRTEQNTLHKTVNHGDHRKPTPLNVTSLNYSPKRKQLRKAVFNDEGDITTRTASSRGSLNLGRTRFGSTRRASVVTVSGDNSLHFSNPGKSSAVMRVVSGAPQLVLAVVSVAVAWVSSLVAIFSRVFWR